MSGRQLSEEIRIARPELRTLFVSGYLDDPRLAAGPGLQVPVLQKPFTPGALLERVRDALDAPFAVLP